MLVDVFKQLCGTFYPSTRHSGDVVFLTLFLFQAVLHLNNVRAELAQEIFLVLLHRAVAAGLHLIDIGHNLQQGSISHSGNMHTGTARVQLLQAKDQGLSR